jgi:hypothetical protein
LEISSVCNSSFRGRQQKGDDWIWKTVMLLVMIICSGDDQRGRKFRRGSTLVLENFQLFLKVSTFVWFSDTHFDEIIYTKS